MTEKTDDVVARTVAWAEAHPDIDGAVLYGSAARGQTHATSDVDLVIVTQPGRRDDIWNGRTRIAAHLLGADIAWFHDLPWQGSHRFQAWRFDLLGIDLTFDEGHLEPHDTFDTGGPVVIAGDLTLPEHTSHEPQQDTSNLIMETWVWFLGIHNQLQQTREWGAYCQLIQLLDARLRPLMGDAELRTLAPAAVTASEVSVALQASVHAYERCSSPVADEYEHGLACAIRDLILGATSR